MRHLIAALLIAPLLTGCGLIATMPDAEPTLGPCDFEDGPGPCYWDAEHRGNGLGDSFVIDADGNVTYTDSDGE